MCACAKHVLRIVFPDFYSRHEIRNPLSAVLQCADNIMTSQQRFDASSDRVVLTKTMREMAESAETILHCGAHMKSIVDGEFLDFTSHLSSFAAFECFVRY